MNPKALDGYEILEEIGQGPSATVYLARHQATRKQVALKLFNESAVANRDTIRSLHREVVISSGLDHPNIVRVFDINETGGRHYIAMDHVDGVPLNRLLEHYKRFETLQACRIVQGMAAGLSYAHRSGISHGNLVPENVLIESQSGRVVMTDFGISRTMARILGQGASNPDRAGFLAPEQLAGANPDDRSDLFALGGMLYYLLTGKRPAPGTVSKPGAALPQMPGLRSLLPNLPIWLETAVARCMSAEPHERFESTTDLIDELEAGLGIPEEAEGEDPLPTTPPPPTEEPAPRIQSRTGDMKLLRAKTAGGTLGMLMRGKNAPIEPESSVKNAERRLLELSFETRSRRPSRRTSASRPSLSGDRSASPSPPPPPAKPEARAEEPALTDWFKSPSKTGQAPPPPRPDLAAPPRTEVPPPTPPPPTPVPAAPKRADMPPPPPPPPRPVPSAAPRTEVPSPTPPPPRPVPSAAPRTEVPSPTPPPPRPVPSAAPRTEVP
ncbi:MAG: serine/threonine protein kinase, partial [Candidatus Xenobium sp.]